MTGETTANLNVRVQPSGSGRVIGTLPKGKKILIEEKGEDWHKIIFNRNEAYVSAKFVEFELIPNNLRRMTRAEIEAKFGKADEKGGYLANIDLPYPMRIAWEKNQTVKRMRCHRLAAGNFLNFFNGLKESYGYDKIVELGIDLFGGCFNYRAMRGGSELSRHSWGIAFDLHPDRNGLRLTREQALFAKPEYVPMMEIAYKVGLVNYGVEDNYDFMHFEVGVKDV